MLRRSTITTWVKRGLLGLLATQVAVVATLIGIDHWRKRVRPHRANFPRTEPASIPVGETTATVYTYGEDLFEDMLDAIRGARHRILFESYIVKSDAVGQEFKSALIEAAERGVEVYVIYDGFANLVVPRSFFKFPPSVRVLRYPAFRPECCCSTCASPVATTARSSRWTVRSASSAVSTWAPPTPSSGATPT